MSILLAATEKWDWPDTVGFGILCVAIVAVVYLLTRK